MVDVLVLEDDGFLSTVLTEALALAGYRVVAASEGLAALALVGEEDGVRLLVADVDLGANSLDGMTVAEEARRLIPDLAVIFVTGSPALLGDQSAARLSRSLFKPFAMQDLVAAVHEMIGPPAH